MQAVFRIRPFCECWTSGSVIGVDMRIDHMRDGHVLGGGESLVFVEIFLTGIDNCAFAQCATTKEIRCASGLVVVIGTKDHRFTPLVGPLPSIREILLLAVVPAVHVCAGIRQHDPHRRSTDPDNTRRTPYSSPGSEAPAEDLLPARIWRRRCVRPRIPALAVCRESQRPLCGRASVVHPYRRPQIP